MPIASSRADDGRLRTGVDLGGTKIEIACLDDAGRVVLRERMATPRGSYEATLAAIAELVAGAEHRIGRPSTSVGIGIPGSLSPRDGTVRNANSTWLNGRRLREDLERTLGREVRVANDANCLAVSEATDGAAAGAGIVFAAILGTGVGAGIAIGGRALNGRNAVAGEWGHIPLPAPTARDRPGSRCWCGRDGCIETYLSGPALLADHHRSGGTDIDLPSMVAAAARREARAVASLERYVDRLGRALATIVNVLDPDAIVLGGGVSNIDALYERLPAAVAPHVFGDTFTTPILRSLHGDSSGVRGAAWLWE